MRTQRGAVAGVPQSTSSSSGDGQTDHWTIFEWQGAGSGFATVDFHNGLSDAKNEDNRW